MTIGVLEALFIQGKLSRVVLLTWYLVCGFGVLVLCLFWVIRGRIARKVHFYGREAPPGIPEGRTEEEMQDCSEDEHFAHPELWDPGRSCGLIPAGFPLQGFAGSGFVWAQDQCQILSPRSQGIMRSSQCHWSRTELFYGGSWLSCCLHLHSHLHKRIFISPCQAGTIAQGSAPD